MYNFYFNLINLKFKFLLNKNIKLSHQITNQIIVKWLFIIYDYPI
jgi:hypothetical protein